MWWGHILNSLSNGLYNLYLSTKSPGIIWNSLETSTSNEKQGMDMFLIMQYFKFLIVDDKLAMNPVHDFTSNCKLTQGTESGDF